MPNDIERSKAVQTIRKFYKGFSVELKLRGKLIGGQPKNPDILKEHLKRKGFTDEQIEKEIEEKNIDKEKEKNWMGFERNMTAQNKTEPNTTLCIRGYQIKGLLKETAKLFNMNTNHKGLKPTLQKIKVKPRKVSLGKTECDGTIEKTGTVLGRLGPRSIITKADYVKKPTLKFEVWVPNNLKVSDELLLELFQAGEEIGLGSMRNFDYGEYDLVHLARIA